MESRLSIRDGAKESRLSIIREGATSRWRVGCPSEMGPYQDGQSTVRQRDGAMESRLSIRDGATSRWRVDCPSSETWDHIKMEGRLSIREMGPYQDYNVYGEMALVLTVEYLLHSKDATKNHF